MSTETFLQSLHKQSAEIQAQLKTNLPTHTKTALKKKLKQIREAAGKAIA